MRILVEVGGEERENDTTCRWEEEDDTFDSRRMKLCGPH